MGKVIDTTGKEIKLHDILKDEESGEMAIVVEGYNPFGSIRGLVVENTVIGINEWLDLCPSGVWTIVGNMADGEDP